MKENYTPRRNVIADRMHFVLAFLLLLSGLNVKAQFSNVPVTGYNADVVINSTGSPSLSSTANATVDNTQYYLADTTWNYTGACTPLSFHMPNSNTVAANSTI